MAKDIRTLGWDYVMFAAFMAFTILTPLWSRLFGKKKQQSKAEYVFATGGVSILAIMLSIARGTLGIRSVLGYPSELYYRGSAMWEVIYGMVAAYPIVCFIFVPVYFNLGITSVYQYIDLRFKSRLVRSLASGTYIFRQICSLAITVYIPSVALSTVIGFPYWASIVGMSAICIFFTIVGGFKAAINADAIQTVAIIFVTMAVIVKGTLNSGGIKNVYKINRDNGRLTFFRFTGDLSVRVDTTSALLGQAFMSLSQFGCQQNFMQRYVSLKSMKDVKRAMMSNIPIIIVFFSLAWLAGMVIYSTYVTCDPLKEQYIQKPDEILPFFVEDQLAFIPGFVGIFMATIFNGALCMNISNLNSLATVAWEDFLSQMPQFKGLTDKQQLSIIKIVTVIFGVVIMGLAFGVGLLSGVIESSMLVFSATSGPLLGVFILAMLIPIANWKGASTGMIISSILILWITFGGLATKNKDNDIFLPTSTEGCSNFTFSQEISKPSDSSWLLSYAPLESSWVNQQRLTTVAPQTIPRQKTVTQALFSISFMYYSLFGTLLTVIIGVIVSYLTSDLKEDSYDAKLLHPIILKWSEYFSGPKPYYIKETENTIQNTNTEKKYEINTKLQFNQEIDGSRINSAFKIENDSSNRIKFEPKINDDVLNENYIETINETNHATKLHEQIIKVPNDEKKLSHAIGSGTYRKINENELV